MILSPGNSGLHLYTWIYRLLRWALGIIFVYSGVIKLISPNTFAVLIDAYGLIPDALLMPVAIVLPAFEVLAGAGLLIDLQGSLAAITGLLLLFVAILGYGIWMGLDVDCGCFGPEDPEAEAFHGLRPVIYRDLAMLATAAVLYGWRRCNDLQPVRLIQLINKQIEKRRTEDAYV